MPLLAFLTATYLRSGGLEPIANGLLTVQHPDGLSRALQYRVRLRGGSRDASRAQCRVVAISKQKQAWSYGVKLVCSQSMCVPKNRARETLTPVALIPRTAKPPGLSQVYRLGSFDHSHTLDSIAGAFA